MPFSSQGDAVYTQAMNVRHYDFTHLIDRPGYSEWGFALRNGTLIPMPQADQQNLDQDGAVASPHLAFDVQPYRNARAGKRRPSHRGIAPLLVGQDVLTFSLCASLAPALMRYCDDAESFGFQLCGPESSGGLLALQLAASVWGHPARGPSIERHDYFERPDLERRATLYHDQPFLLERPERWFALDTARKKLEHIRELGSLFINRAPLCNGSASAPTRTILMTETSRPVEELCGNDQASRDYLGDRLLLIPVPPSRKGAFIADPPNDVASSIPELVEKLNDHIRVHYGHSARRFISKVLTDVAGNDGADLRKQVRKLVRRFVECSGVDINDGPALRAATRFGLVSAAGELGKTFGALPDELDTDAAVLACYRMHVAAPGGQTVALRLRELIGTPQVVDLGSGKLPAVSGKQRKRALAYVRTKHGRTLVFVKPSSIKDVLPEWDSIEGTPAVRNLLQVEGKSLGKDNSNRHLTRKKTLGKGRKEERVFCFLLPSETVDGGDDADASEDE